MDTYTHLKNIGAGQAPVRKSAMKISKSTRDQVNKALAMADEILSSPKAKEIRRQASLKNQAWLAKEVAREQVMKPIDDKLASETVRRGLLAQADSDERLAVIADQRADEAEASMLRAPTELVSYYSAKKAEHRRKAREHRETAEAHRKAARAL